MPTERGPELKQCIDVAGADFSRIPLCHRAQTTPVSRLEARPQLKLLLNPMG